MKISYSLLIVENSSQAPRVTPQVRGHFFCDRTCWKYLCWFEIKIKPLVWFNGQQSTVKGDMMSFLIMYCGLYCVMTFSYHREGLLEQNKRSETETSSDECQNDWVEEINRNWFPSFDMISVHKVGGKVGDVMV